MKKSKIVIRPMAQADLPAVLAVTSNAFDRDHAQRAQPEFNEMFGSAAFRPFFYVAESGAKIVGLAGYGTSWLAYGVYEMFWVGVLKENRGQHLGRALVEHCLLDLATVADQVVLVTCKHKFFEKCGFTVLGPLPTRNGSKDVLMFKKMRRSGKF